MSGEADVRVREDGRILVGTLTEVTDDQILLDRAVDALQDEFGDEIEVDVSRGY